MSASELKRCPFCGGEGRIIIVQSVGICVVCLNCQARTCGVNDEQSAIDAWNRRAGDEAHRREVAELRECLKEAVVEFRGKIGCFLEDEIDECLNCERTCGFSSHPCRGRKWRKALEGGMKDEGK